MAWYDCLNPFRKTSNSLEPLLPSSNSPTKISTGWFQTILNKIGLGDKSTSLKEKNVSTIPRSNSSGSSGVGGVTDENPPNNQSTVALQQRLTDVFRGNEKGSYQAFDNRSASVTYKTGNEVLFKSEPPATKEGQEALKKDIELARNRLIKPDAQKEAIGRIKEVKEALKDPAAVDSVIQSPEERELSEVSSLHDAIIQLVTKEAESLERVRIAQRNSEKKGLPEAEQAYQESQVANSPIKYYESAKEAFQKEVDSYSKILTAVRPKQEDYEKSIEKKEGQAKVFFDAAEAAAGSAVRLKAKEEGLLNKQSLEQSPSNQQELTKVQQSLGEITQEIQGHVDNYNRVRLELQKYEKELAATETVLELCEKYKKKAESAKEFHEHALVYFSQQQELRKLMPKKNLDENVRFHRAAMLASSQEIQDVVVRGIQSRLRPPGPGLTTSNEHIIIEKIENKLHVTITMNWERSKSGKKEVGTGSCSFELFPEKDSWTPTNLEFVVKENRSE